MSQYPTVVHQQPAGYGQSSNTTIIFQQPANTPRQWSSGICSCFDDMAICCCGLFCGTCLLMRTASRMNEHVCLPCCVPFSMTALRVKLRTQENIAGSIWDDHNMSVWCGPCANCQLARELQLVQQRCQR